MTSLSPKLRPGNQVAAMVAVAGGEIDQHDVPHAVGQLMKQGRDGAPRPKGAVQPRELDQVLAQCLLVLVGQVHQLGFGGGEVAAHDARMPIVELASPFFRGKRLRLSLHFSQSAIAMGRASISYRGFNQWRRLPRAQRRYPGTRWRRPTRWAGKCSASSMATRACSRP